MEEINKVEISDNLSYKLFKSMKDTILVLDITYKKSLVSRMFTNNIDGREKLDKFLKTMDSEEKVKTYLGL
jgi:hypothetical protein